MKHGEMEHEMKLRNFREMKDALVGPEPAHERGSESLEHDEGLRSNADPAAAERIYRMRDAQAVVGGCADERMNRPGRLGTAKEGGLAFGSGDGEVKPGPAWLEGLRNRTPVQHNPSGKNDQHDVNRPRPVTY
jgi:hypothetical protein